MAALDREELRSGVHWGVAHGLPTLFLRRAAARETCRPGSSGSGRPAPTRCSTSSRRSGRTARSTARASATSPPATPPYATCSPATTSAPGCRRRRAARPDLPLGGAEHAPPGRAAVAAGDRAARPHPLPQARHPRLHHAGGRAAARADRGDRRRPARRARDPRPTRRPRRRRTAAVLPVTVIAEILGVPERDRGRVLDFGTAAAPSLDLGLSWSGVPPRREGAARSSRPGWPPTWTACATPRRRPDEPARRRARRGSRASTTTELKATAGLVLAAGFETTVNLLGNGIALLARPPRRSAPACARDPTLWSNVVDEVLRLDPPVLLTGRIASARHRGRRAAGARAASWSRRSSAGANRDPAGLRRPDCASTSRAPTPATTSPSRPVATTASAPRWRGWRARSGCARSVRALPRPAARARRRAPRDPHPAGLRDAPGHVAPLSAPRSG